MELIEPNFIQTPAMGWYSRTAPKAAIQAIEKRICYSWNPLPCLPDQDVDDDS